MPARFEERGPLRGNLGITAVRPVVFKRDQFVLNQRFNVGTVQIARFTSVVNHEKHSEFMGTQHSCLRRVSVGSCFHEDEA